MVNMFEESSLKRVIIVCLAVGTHDSMQFMYVCFVFFRIHLPNSSETTHYEMHACNDKHFSFFELQIQSGNPS